MCTFGRLLMAVVLLVIAGCGGGEEGTRGYGPTPAPEYAQTTPAPAGGVEVCVSQGQAALDAVVAHTAGKMPAASLPVCAVPAAQ